ncbi:MAG: hypothetical protein HW421_2810 [Ignavibacteria bacterium]|nr:hypothetical protein [Ignavibacteria bacterium]
MKYQKILFIILIFTTPISSCNSQEQNPNNKRVIIQADIYPHAVTVPEMKCSSDSSQTYSYYLPKKYKITEKFPIIYVFDPKARGALAVNKFCNAAEKFGWIVIGSNIIRNKLTWQEIQRSLDVLFEDTYNKFSIDVRRVYTAGFSGGARVAASVAILSGNIEGVIACAAGLPNNSKPEKTNFEYIGCVGNADFNYSEMQNLEARMNEWEMSNYFIYFNGKHDWSPDDVIMEAFERLEISAMKKGLVAKNADLTSSLMNRLNAKISQNRNVGLPVDANIEYYMKIVSTFGGLIDVSEYKKLIYEHGNTNEYKSYIAQKKQFDSIEAEGRIRFSQAFNNKDFNQLKKMVQNLKKDIKSTKNTDKKFSLIRIQSTLSLLSFMYSINELNVGNIDNAKGFTDLYEMVDPENPDLHYLRARLSAAKGKLDEALDYLDKAVAAGYDDIATIDSDKVFEQLKNNDKFQTIQKGILKNRIEAK